MCARVCVCVCVCVFVFRGMVVFSLLGSDDRLGVTHALCYKTRRHLEICARCLACDTLMACRLFDVYVAVMKGLDRQ